MLVPVSFVRGMTMLVMHVVLMSIVRDGGVAAAGSVHMVVGRVFRMEPARALVPMRVVIAVPVSVVEVVRMVAVLHAGMATVRGVAVLVGLMSLV